MAEKPIWAIIEARMNSSRLPGKVLLPAQGKPLLVHLFDRLKAVEGLAGIAVATTIAPADEEILAVCEEQGVPYFRGSSQDVLARVVGAADHFGAGAVLEITADCPIIDPELVQNVVDSFVINDVTLVSNANFRSFPDGMDASVVSVEALRYASENALEPLDREHVLRYISHRPSEFPAVHIVAPRSLTWPELGLTLDEPADYRLIGHLIDVLSSSNQIFGCAEVVKYLRDNPSVVAMNEHVRRKGDS